MCITFIAVNKHSKYKFILLFNREEYFHRETLPIGFNYQEEEYKDILFLPIDLQSGGTFLCLNVKNFNFCCLLNIAQEYIPFNPYIKLKRASIPIEFCKQTNTDNFQEFFTQLRLNKKDYNGFNILCGNMKTGEIYYDTNYEVSYDLPLKMSTEEVIGLGNSAYGIESMYVPRINYGELHLLDLLMCQKNLTPNDLFDVMNFDLRLTKAKLPEIDPLNPGDLSKNLKVKEYLVSHIYMDNNILGYNIQYGTMHTFCVMLDNEDRLLVNEYHDEIYQDESMKFTKKKREEGKFKSYQF